MREQPKPNDVPLTMAALRIRDSYHNTRKRMLCGELRGRQIEGRWYVADEDVRILEAQRAEPIAQTA